MSKTRKKNEEPKRWLDDPANVRKFLRGFYLACGICLRADVVCSIFWHKHEAFPGGGCLAGAESFPMFYGLYGFAACAALILVSKLMRSYKGRSVLMREEDYWSK